MEEESKKALKFAPCDKLGCSKASIPQIVFQAIVASFLPQKPAFLRRFPRGIMAKNFTALNKDNAHADQNLVSTKQRIRGTEECRKTVNSRLNS